MSSLLAMPAVASAALPWMWLPFPIERETGRGGTVGDFVRFNLTFFEDSANIRAQLANSAGFS
jgi:hypothetical protein